MIGYIKGAITQRNPTNVYVETHGVGYIINISLFTYESLEGLAAVKLYTHLAIKEDSHTLYGFFTEAEKGLFLHLLSVSGVGTNTARVMLSYMNPSDLKRAILQEDVATIHKIKGIGPKTAKRIILDLKDKLAKENTENVDQISISSNTIKDEALSALISLGFQKTIIEKRIDTTLKSNPEISQVEDLIKLILKQVK